MLAFGAESIFCANMAQTTGALGSQRSTSPQQQGLLTKQHTSRWLFIFLSPNGYLC